MANNRELLQSSSESEEEVDETSSEEEGSESESEPERTQVALKAKPQHHPSPSSSSSSDEEDSGSESESDSDGPDSNVNKPIATKPMTEPHKTSKSIDSGSESESDSDGSDSSVKPIATKSMAEPPKTTPAAGNPKLKSESVVTPARSTTGKRPPEEKQTEGTDAKKAKKSKEPETASNIKSSNDDSKKILFQRIWSEDDEIVILKGMIDYATNKKSDPMADLNAFHDFIKKNLHVVEVTRAQLQDKIRRLKKKYENNKNKEKEGKDRTFSKSHEQNAYDLSKKIWGNENGTPKANGTSTVKKTTAAKANANTAEVDEEVKDVESVEALNGIAEQVLPSASKLKNFSGGGIEENILRIGAELFAAGKGTEAEKEWDKLKLEEIKVFQRQLQLKTARVKLVLDYLKSTDH